MKSCFLLLGVLLASTPGAQGQCSPELLAPPLAQPGYLWGTSLAVDGARMAVGTGSPGFASNGYVDVMLKTSAGWILEQRIDAPTPADPGGSFGGEVDIDGDRLIVGARFWDGSGHAFVYERIAGTWTLAADLSGPVTGESDSFGAQVNVSGDTAIVSAPREDLRSGRVYIFQRDAAGQWNPLQVLDDGSPAFNEFFGLDVDLIPGRLAISGSGTVRVYEPMGGTWQQTVELSAPAGEYLTGANLGGDLLVAVYGLSCPDGGYCATGVARIFRKAGSSWNVAGEVVPSLDGLESNFAIEVAIDGSDIYLRANGLISIYGIETPAAVYRFEEGTQGWTQTMRWFPVEIDPYVYFGNDLVLSDGQLVVSQPGSSAFAPYAGNLAFYDLIPQAEQYCIATESCPCGNNSGAGGCGNSLTSPFFPIVSGVLEVCGSTSVGLDDFTLQASRLPENQFALLSMGASLAAPIALGDGRFCLDASAPGLARFPASPTGADGTFQEGPGLIAFTQSSLPAASAITAGSSWSFQAWYRDPGGPCGSGSNLTNAVRATFVP